MKIATFNINNVNRRLDNLLAWLAAAKPDVVCLQELKATDKQFPRSAIEAAGYGAVWRGQSAWNGVAILARDAEPILTRTELPGDPSDTQSRYIEAAVGGIVVASLYAPNGNPQPGPKFEYKLRWCERLIAHAAELYATACRSFWPGTTISCPSHRTFIRRSPITRTRWCSRRAAPLFAGCLIRVGLTLSVRSTRRGPSTRSGTTCETAGHGMQASVSTTFCSVGKWRAGWLTQESTGRYAVWREPATTPRSGSGFVPDRSTLPDARRLMRSDTLAMSRAFRYIAGRSATCPWYVAPAAQ